jgi:hypothetical protein
MSNVWDIPYSPKFKVGNTTESIIYEAVGRALSKWEGLKRDGVKLNRFGIPKSACFWFTMLAGQEASMDGQALLSGSSESGGGGY